MQRNIFFENQKNPKTVLPTLQIKANRMVYFLLDLNKKLFPVDSESEKAV